MSLDNFTLDKTAFKNDIASSGEAKLEWFDKEIKIEGFLGVITILSEEKVTKKGDPYVKIRYKDTEFFLGIGKKALGSQLKAHEPLTGKRFVIGNGGKKKSETSGNTYYDFHVYTPDEAKAKGILKE